MTAERYLFNHVNTNYLATPIEPGNKCLCTIIVILGVSKDPVVTVDFQKAAIFTMQDSRHTVIQISEKYSDHFQLNDTSVFCA